MSPRYSQLLQLLEDKPGDAFLLFAKAQEERKHSAIEQAIATFEELRSIDPDYVGTYYHLAALYAGENVHDKTEEVYRAGIEVALRQNDQHALAELKNAYVNWQLDE